MRIEDVIEAILAARQAHVLNPGATEEQIARCEQRLGVRIVGEYRQFLRFSNGALLYETEELLGVSRVRDFLFDIEEVVGWLRNPEVAPLPSDYVPFYLGPGSQYFCLNRYGQVVEWLGGKGPGSLTYPSFTVWFEEAVYTPLHFRYT